jgi:hypothetical protein
MATFRFMGINRAIASPRRVMVTSPSAANKRSRCDKERRASRIESFIIYPSPSLMDLCQHETFSVNVAQFF